MGQHAMDTCTHSLVAVVEASVVCCLWWSNYSVTVKLMSRWVVGCVVPIKGLAWVYTSPGLGTIRVYTVSFASIL